ncbi:GMC family oxidoreductase [Solimicrobium silvestre]|uniref:Choline dehydrogenase and related flavoprotein n=1 Tax=Solimicrobium silvestre TaxID=2099400 RepID=A0A2S9H2F9_9BURK|nr:GMC family oxidoreductase N-terminal domain-containing protein [Solimicrobium silvestre]PRC94171.1 Choline dehydrogenase and related flavoprotein [Solimicrobium silvestre]
MTEIVFDYIVIGGGSGACATAGRLSEDSTKTVLVLEAGGEGKDWAIRIPAGAITMLPTKYNNWAFQTVPQAGLNGRRGYQPRGKALGGSSVLNAMVYIRGQASDYDHWAALGNTGWSFNELLPYFKRAENNADFTDAFHGNNGPLHVGKLRTDNPFQQIYLNAAQQAGFPLNNDFNGVSQEGAGTYQVTQFNGERWSAARAYLEPHRATRSNLHVMTGAHVTQILFEDEEVAIANQKRAVAVKFTHNGQVKTARAKSEIILAAGALQSPQLLMLSGVGDRTELEKLGIPVVHHLPGVGNNLQDHPDMVLNYTANSLDLMGFSVSGAWRMARECWRYITKRRGMLSTNYAEGGAFLKTSPELPSPDVQLHFVIGVVEDHARKLRWGHGYSCHVCILRPKSRGSVRLASANPHTAPLIDPNFFSDPDDLEVMLKGLKLTQKLMDAPALKNIRTSALTDADAHSDDELRELIRQRADTVYHPVGSCKMGLDAMSVVDPQLRVYGVKGLRIADASIMPTLISGNTNAICMVIGEKAAEFIFNEKHDET